MKKKVMCHKKVPGGAKKHALQQEPRTPMSEGKFSPI